MKINYKNTALEFLDNPKNVAIHTPDAYNKVLSKAEDYKLLYGLQNQFAELGFADHFKKKIQYITQPFYDAYRRAENKLKEFALKEEIDDSGTLIIQHKEHTQTIFYRLKTKGEDSMEGLECFMVMFTKAPRNDSFGLDLSIYFDREGKQVMDIIWKGFIDQGRDFGWWVAELILFKTFLKYADVETKVVPAKKKEHHIGIKYLNETKNKVEILDSTYFTTISRTEGFGVRGHFRFQVCGHARTGRKLIWISDFKKQGYTRKAKILTQSK